MLLQKVMWYTCEIYVCNHLWLLLHCGYENSELIGPGLKSIFDHSSPHRYSAITNAFIFGEGSPGERPHETRLGGKMRHPQAGSSPCLFHLQTMGWVCLVLRICFQASPSVCSGNKAKRCFGPLARAQSNQRHE